LPASRRGGRRQPRYLMNILRAFLVGLATVGAGCVPLDEGEAEEEDSAAIASEEIEAEPIGLDTAIAVAACFEAGLCREEDRMPRKPPKPTKLDLCYKGCEGGLETMEAFCRALRDWRLRLACWPVAKGSEVACKGWCYWHWGK
jgi:hypothetical protein